MSLVTHVSYGIAAAAGLASGQLGYACLAVALVVMVGGHTWAVRRGRLPAKQPGR
jgi:hypothetical protein